MGATADPIDQMRHQRPRDSRLSTVRSSEGGGEPVSTDPLQQIAGSTAHDRVDDVILAVRAAQNDDQRLRRRSGDPVDRAQTVFGQLELDEADIRPQPRGHADGQRRLVCFTDDEKVVGLERLANAATMLSIVVRDENCQMLEGGVAPRTAGFYFSCLGLERVE
jgi:hypothetical protein